MTINNNLVLREDSGGVASLSLNCPQQGNSLSLETIDAISDHLMALRREKSIGVIVLRGIGKNIFCAGHDLREFVGEDDPEFFKTVSVRCSSMMQAMREQPQIIIARVEGVASAAGCQLVANADLAIASRDARFATPGVKHRPVVPDADGGAVPRRGTEACAADARDGSPL